MYAILKQSEDTPCYVQEWDKIEHWDSSEEVHEWKLSEYRSKDVHGLQSHKFIAVEAQVFLKTRDVGIVCV
jgi:hypothetical protein